MEIFFVVGAILPPLVFLAGSYLIARKWSIGRHASISAHGGQSRETLRLFSAMTILLAIWYYAIWLFYISQRIEISYFPILFLIATICILLVSFIPARPSLAWALYIHRGAATILGLVMVLLSYSIASNIATIPLAYYFYWAFIIYCTFMAIVCMFFVKLRNYSYLIEVTGILLFSTATSILAISLIDVAGL